MIHSARDHKGLILAVVAINYASTALYRHWHIRQLVNFLIRNIEDKRLLYKGIAV